jgi:hypothetical protein
MAYSGNDYLKPKGVDTSDLDKRHMKNGQFHNPPFLMEYGGLSTVGKAKFEQNKMTLEKGGPQATRGRPI